LTVSPSKCARLLKNLGLNHRQLVEPVLIRPQGFARSPSTSGTLDRRGASAEVLVIWNGGLSVFFALRRSDYDPIFP
jgi:hypothetical protein